MLNKSKIKSNIQVDYTMAYTKRTCHKCGFRNIQPNMRQEEIEYVSGSSQAGLSTRAVIGATLLNDDRAGRQIANWATGNTKRQYKRKKHVWVCANGCNNTQISSKPKQQVSVQEYKPRTDHEVLVDDLKHNEYMFGELSLWLKDFDKLKEEMGNISNLTKAEARQYNSKMENIFVEIKHKTVSLGKIYQESNNQTSEYFDIFKKIVNIIMWGWGLLCVFVVFYF